MGCILQIIGERNSQTARRVVVPAQRFRIAEHSDIGPGTGFFAGEQQFFPRPLQAKGVNQAAIFAPRVANVIAFRPQCSVARTSVIDSFSINLEPVASSAELALGFGMKFTCGTWADADHEASAFGD